MSHDDALAPIGDTLLEFPCQFPIKAMGRAGGDLPAIVSSIVERHAGRLEDSALRTRPSRSGKWLAVTVTIEAQSKDQLDAIYTELTAHESIVWAL